MASRLSLRIRRHILDVDVDLDLAAAPITVLFGPSGAGKTTLLRCVAGLDSVEAGSRIALDDSVWDDSRVHVPARKRRIGYLFQDHALFPHLDVSANVAFGLRGVPRRQRPGLVQAALAQAGAAHLASRDTRQLSGGEAQRVALARALAPAPQLLLLDEPLSALDSPTRAKLRGELRSALLAAGRPAVLVTHDRSEALALGDQIAVLVDGRVRQVGPPAEVFSRPADRDVADVVEMETVVSGLVGPTADGLVTVDVAGVRLVAVNHEPELAPGSPALVCIRAEEVALAAPGRRGEASPRNHLPGVVQSVADEGPLVRVSVDVGFTLEAFVTRPTREEMALAPGSPVVASVKAPAVHLVAR